MEIQILSDLHLEFYEDSGKQVLSEMDPSGVDVLIVAGDLATASHCDFVLNTLADMYPHVVFVVGNHDYYRSSFKWTHRGLTEVCTKRRNLHWLHNTSVTLHGQRFLGTPLWFPDDPMNPIYERFLNDFSQIPDFRDWVYTENARAVSFLEREVGSEDIVITHHLPSMACVPERFLREPLNRFFVCDMEGLIRTQNPQIWIHGHTHETVHFTLGETLMVCNPRGYSHGPNRNFNPKLVIEV